MQLDEQNVTKELTMRLSVSSKGDFSKTLTALNNIRGSHNAKVLEKYGAKGVEALRQATPKDTGLTSNSWYYEFHSYNDVSYLYWSNSNRVKGVLIAAVLQYGHATPSGTYYPGIDYINPAMAPIFKDIKKKLWGGVTEK